MTDFLKERFLKLGIKAKLGLLTASMVALTLLITLVISSYREVEFKKAEARKLMINLGKQIGLLKGLSLSPSQESFAEYLEKTVHSVISRKGYTMTIVYIITTTPDGQIELPVFNLNMIHLPHQDPLFVAKEILSKKFLIGPGIQDVAIDVGNKGSLHVGFSMQILISEIWESRFEHLAIGIILIIFGIGAAMGLANKITEPLFTLIQGFEKVSKGDFEAQVHIQTHDELQELAQSFNEMTAGLRERETIKDVFRRYATDQVVEKILSGEVRPTLSGELCEVTVLFSDIRMFTSIATKLSPQQVVYLLNLFFTAMTDVVIQNEGLIDKFSGDEIMVVFGAPIHHLDHPERALRTALQMMKELERVNEKLVRENYPKIDIGIGISTGVAVAGNVGSEKRMAYTVIGQDVNLAARLVSIANKGEILLSEVTYKRVSGIIQAKPEETLLKGLDKPLTVYRITP
ncbi:MAG: adenylate/guanylate cyclase domain-containing protein [Chlamydiae bacterium]|nr:adenylate/guanylate cyclase domain-containing protein [Chlamydiota bacterium]MBI3276323.1 adenylate/guanylate cyclase domain-containing protein [Chlamydiota bacterium]